MVSNELTNLLAEDLWLNSISSDLFRIKITETEVHWNISLYINATYIQRNEICLDLLIFWKTLFILHSLLKYQKCHLEIIKGLNDASQKEWKLAKC